MPFWDIENLRRTSRQLASRAERAREIRESHATKRGRPGAGESGLSRLRRLFSLSKARIKAKARIQAVPVEDDLALGKLSEREDIRCCAETRTTASDRDGRDHITNPSDVDLEAPVRRGRSFNSR